MAITTAMCTSFKQELLQGLHNFTATTGDGFKIALIKTGMAGTYGAATTNYSDVTGNSDEVPNGDGYTTTGEDLTNVTPTTSSTTALTDFSPDITWSTATISARGAIIYNTDNSNAAVMVGDFGSDKASSGGDFTVAFPAADASNAIIRIA